MHFVMLIPFEQQSVCVDFSEEMHFFNLFPCSSTDLKALFQGVWFLIHLFAYWLWLNFSWWTIRMYAIFCWVTIAWWPFPLIQTPLIEAARNGHLDCVEILLLHGADKMICNVLNLMIDQEDEEDISGIGSVLIEWISFLNFFFSDRGNEWIPFNTKLTLSHSGKC